MLYSTRSLSLSRAASDLIRLSGLKLLELALEAQVGAGAGPDHPHCSQRLLPAQTSDRHDVRQHQGDAAGHAR